MLHEACAFPEFRDYHCGDIAEFSQNPENIAVGVSAGQQPAQLGENALCGYLIEQLPVIVHSPCGVFLYLKPEGSREAQSAQDTQSVLAEALFRLAYAAYHARFDVLGAAKFVEISLLGIVGYAVHREVPAGNVVADIPGECDALRAAAVAVFAVHAVGGYLDGGAVCKHRDCPVLQSGLYQAVSRKDLLGLRRERRRRYVVVMRDYPHQAVTDAASNHPGFMSCGFQHVQRAGDILRQYHCAPPFCYCLIIMVL